MPTFRPYATGAAIFAVGVTATCVLSDSAWAWIQNVEALVLLPKLIAILSWGQAPVVTLVAMLIGFFLQTFVLGVIVLIPFWALSNRRERNAT